MPLNPQYQIKPGMSVEHENETIEKRYGIDMTTPYLTGQQIELMEMGFDVGIDPNNLGLFKPLGLTLDELLTNPIFPDPSLGDKKMETIIGSGGGASNDGGTKRDKKNDHTLSKEADQDFNEKFNSYEIAPF